jgi:GNAT superfamily N-acetyltransferase
VETTGPNLLERHTLRDGTRVLLRHIQPSDKEELHRSFHALSPESRYRRFFAGMTDLSDASLEYLCNVDGRNHVAIVALIESNDLKEEHGVGVARFVRLEKEPDVAEIAVTVVDDQQKKGLGTLLLATAARAAVARHITHFRAEVLASNEPMLDLLRDAGATLRPTPDGTVLVDAEIAPGEARPGLLMRALAIAAAQVNVFLRRFGPP